MLAKLSIVRETDGITISFREGVRETRARNSMFLHLRSDSEKEVVVIFPSQSAEQTTNHITHDKIVKCRFLFFRRAARFDDEDQRISRANFENRKLPRELRQGGVASRLDE